MEKFDEDFPFDKHRKMIEQLTHIQSSLLFQLRSNHLNLNSYLHRIGKTPSKRCEQCWRRRRVESTETVTHFLFECPSFERERHVLDAKLGRSSRDLKTILSDVDKTRALLSYIGRTRCFKEIGDVSLMKNPPWNGRMTRFYADPFKESYPTGNQNRSGTHTYTQQYKNKNYLMH